jgi:hypothetical protein
LNSYRDQKHGNDITGIALARVTELDMLLTLAQVARLSRLPGGEEASGGLGRLPFDINAPVELRSKAGNSKKDRCVLQNGALEGGHDCVFLVWLH